MCIRDSLESLPENPEHTIKHCVYMRRIQQRISRELDMLLWLAINHPQVFLDREHDKNIPNRRLKKLLLALKALNPRCDVELVLSNLKIPREE